MKLFRIFTTTIIVFIAGSAGVQAQTSSATNVHPQTLRGHLPKAVASMTPSGRLAVTNELRLAIGLPLYDPAGLEQFLADIYDPASPNYHHYLSVAELTARFGPREADYAAVKEFARTNGFIITAEHPNHLLLNVVSRAANVEKAFHIKLYNFKHPNEAREFFAPDAEPTVDATLPIADIQGLSDYSRPHPHLHKVLANALPKTGTAPDGSGSYFANDFRNAYAAGTTNTGAGQIVGLLQFDGYYAADITKYATSAGGGRTNIVLQKVLLDGFNGTPTTGVNSGNSEVALDIEMSMAMAPGLSKIVVFEAGPTGLPNDILNSMLTFSNTIKQLSCSWGWDGGPNVTTDNIFQLMAGAGQSFFNASGDSDAFVTGSNNDVNNTNQVNIPSGSPYITQVGGTTLTMSGSGVSFASETVWNDGTVNANGGYWGSTGGICTLYNIPSWQAATSMSANSGSTTKRNIPDVALTANNVYCTYDNGSAGAFGGTSCAAPLWAGYMALVNQQAAANGIAPAGFINPAVYNLSRTANYTNCFHDVTTGNNAWPSSAGKYAAVTGYDLATGLGTPNGVNLINALAPLANTPPAITTSPQSQTNTLGGTGTFSVIATGSAPLGYQWYFIDAISGATNASLVISNAATTNAGNYFVIVTNSFGSATSSVATLTVTLAPTVLSFAPAFGATNDSITITGLLFSNVTAVSFNGAAASYAVNSSSSITATVPVDANSGPISVTTVNGTGSSANSFTVLAGNGAPAINSLNPTNGLVNSSVVITGTNFAGVTGVGFNGLNANFTADSLSQITAHVPVGAADGFITVTNGYGIGTSAAVFTIATNPVNPVGISQIFGGGGNSGSAYQNDYIELYNRSGGAVDVSGWSLQYASSGGTTWSEINLTGSIQPGHYYLVQCAGGSTGSALPVPDASGTAISMSATKGKVALMNTQTVIASGSSSPIGLTGLQDFVGYGSANAYEGSGPAPTISATSADFRTGGGGIDTDDNSVDFTAGTPNPRNSAYSTVAATDLTLNLRHTGNFSQGDPNDIYTITVTNSGTLASSGTVTVVDTLPAGLTATAISGTGWTTTLGTLTCTRADALSAASSYPPITLTVSVATNAAVSVTNTVTVSGGGDANAANNTATDPTIIIAVNPVTNQPPSVITSAASGLTTNVATLNGSLNPNGQSTTAQFEYGLTTSYGTIVPLAGAFTGSNSIAVGTNLTGLTPATTYHFRLDATNATGLMLGNDQSFTTLAVSSGGTAYSGILAGWDVSGSSGTGASPLTSTTNAPNVSVTGISRGSGLSTGGATATRAWGASAWSTTTAAAGVSATQFVTFTLTLTNGGTLSISNLSRFDYRHSGNGPTSGLLQVQVGSGAFTDLTNVSYSSSSSSGASLGVIDLSGFSILQNIPAGTHVNFRLVNYGATSSGGTWYLFDVASSTALDFSISGSVASLVTGTGPAITTQPADANIFAGKNSSFAVSATGTAPLVYQWRKEGAALMNNSVFSGVSNATLALVSATTNQTGGYSVVVSNFVGSVTSRVATLSVVPVPALLLSNSPNGLVIDADGGAVSNQFIVLMTTNLTTSAVWIPISTNVIGAGGQIRFTETNLAAPFQFYRLLFP